MNDTGKVPEVEEIMGFGRSGEQVVRGTLIDGHRCGNDGLADGLDFSVEAFGEMPVMMRLKIRVMAESLNSLMVMVLKWRRKRGVTGLRPPPGGPMAAISRVSTRVICEKTSINIRILTTNSVK